MAAELGLLSLKISRRERHATTDVMAGQIAHVAPRETCSRCLYHDVPSFDRPLCSPSRLAYQKTSMHCQTLLPSLELAAEYEAATAVHIGGARALRGKSSANRSQHRGSRTSHVMYTSSLSLQSVQWGLSADVTRTDAGSLERIQDTVSSFGIK